MSRMNSVTDLLPGDYVARGVVTSSPQPRAHTSTERAEAGRETGGDISADQSSPVAFEIPLPPSANHLFRNVKGVGRVKTKEYDDFTMMAIAAIRRQKVGRIAGHVVMVWGFERGSALADVSNRLKAAEDSIVKAGVIEDDRFVTAHFLTWTPPANGLAHVQIWPAQNLAFEFHPSHSGASGAIIVTAPQPNGEEDGYQPV